VLVESLLAGLIAPCRAPLPRAPALPAPVVAWSSCGAFRVATDGRVSRLPRHWLALHGSGTGRRWGAKLAIRRNRAGRHFLLRRGRVVWRSRGLYPDDAGSIAFGPGLFAFASYGRGVFLTDLQHAERLVVRGQALYPLDFTEDGDLVVVARHELVLVSRAGSVVRRLRFRPRNSFALDGRSGTLFFVTPGGRLAAAHDRRVQLGRSVATIGGPISTPARGVVVFGGMRTIVVTRADGSIVARARWRSSRVGSDSGVSASPDGRLFAFRLTDARPGSKRATATVYFLRAGATRAVPILRHRLGPSGCAVGANLFWRGHFLLYSSTDGHRAIVDTATRAVTDLTSLAAALPHRSAAERASLAWASDFRGVLGSSTRPS
jgi:hypothetical protein